MQDIGAGNVDYTGGCDRAVAIGRPLYWGLAVDGANGVHGVLELLREELGITKGTAEQILANEEKKLEVINDSEEDKCPHCGNKLISEHNNDPLSLVKAV